MATPEPRATLPPVKFDFDKYFPQKVETSYTAELFMYGLGIFIGAFAVFFTARRIFREKRSNLVIAARLMSYKVSLTIADLIILFVYAPTQFIWILTYHWYGGDLLCRLYKFVMTFGFHVTANMQVLIALDRLYITTRLNHVGNTRKNSHGRFGQNHNAYIILAYLLAFSCALPQLFVFQLYYMEEKHPQCSSIWIISRLVYYKDKVSMVVDEFYKATGEMPDLKLLTHENMDDLYKFCYKNNISVPAGIPKLEEEYYKLLFIEQVYNIFHLISICVIPYLIELLCYASILYLLKGAKKGQFLNFKDITRMKWVWCAIPRFFRHKPKYKESKKKGLMKIDIEIQKLPLTESSHDDDEATVTRSTILPEDTSARRSSLLISFDGRSTISDGPTVGLISTDSSNPSSTTSSNVSTERSTQTASPGLLLSVQTALHKYGRGSVAASAFQHRPSWMKSLNERRRASCPETVHNNAKPWMNTVAVARKRTRKKAFYMLTLNLIFWTPYCLLGIITAITVFEQYHHFQFVCALIVFNAITNIIL
ncbi:unnamed protein product, partial [Mesorhabditis spiculigera]